MPEPLPIDEHVSRIVESLRRRRALVLVAEPGAGKTTRVPPALVADGPVFLLQPRRVAARAIARRIAGEQGWTVGGEVGWQVRFEREYSERTKLLVATEGVLTARMQSDPLLSDFRTVVLDEFHERTLHADLALAFLREAMDARDDLRVVVMSATLDAEPVAGFLGGAGVLEVAGRPHEVTVAHAPGLGPADGVRRALSRGGGHVLCFLPGAGEIRAVLSELQDLGPGVAVLPLHGRLDASAQDRALAPGDGRKVVLATNVAETSLTVEGVSDVVDTGLHRVLRFDAARALDRLETERIPADSAEQRRGRAGRTGPGHALRLWDARDRLRPHREPEIHRVDLAAPVLDVLAWGGDPARFRWFDPPAPDRLDAALSLLRRLGAVDGGRLTARGRAAQRLPLHPRLGTVLLVAGGGARAAATCAMLSEPRAAATGERATTDSDVLSLADRLGEASLSVRQAARELERIGGRLGGNAGADDDAALRRALLAGFPDRVARRRENRSSRLLLANGAGAVLGRESGVREGDFLLALEVRAGAGPGGEALVTVASRVEREWLEPTGREIVHAFDGPSGAVRAAERLRYAALVLEEKSVPPSPESAAPLLVAALAARGLDPQDEALMARAAFAEVEIDIDALRRRACAGRTRLPAGGLRDWIDPATRQAVDRGAPLDIPLPSGRRARLQYRPDGTVMASVKLQELFGLAETPRAGRRQAPVLLELLAPSGRPVQTTADLRSFWTRTYPEVRRELRGRYPRHPWPEDPWTARATHRTTRRQ
jgi:ATP-dependent helicase HrpB